MAVLLVAISASGRSFDMDISRGVFTASQTTSSHAV